MTIPVATDTQRTPALARFEDWQRRVVQANQFSCRPIPFAQSTQWSLVEGILRHRTGGFFSLAGLRAEARDPHLHGQEQLIILQPQIAINGFLFRRHPQHGPQILFQGRVEPGNVGGMQMAPTVQSTEANYKRLHGGKPTPFADWFLEQRGRVVFDERQSEEATRYYGKYNQNIVLEISPDADPPLSNQFCWFSMSDIADLLVRSNVLNTDTRSVLTCMDWDLLAGERRPFEETNGDGFRSALRRSYEARPQQWPWSTQQVFTWLTRQRVYAALRHRVLRIDELANWVMDAHEIREREPRLRFRARQFQVTAVGREVGGWDQPLIDSDGAGRLTLVCQKRDGLLQFLLKASREIGYLEGVQLSTTIATAPGAAGELDQPLERELAARIERGDGARVHAACRQSEEGGRFYMDENDYQIVELDEGVSLPASDQHVWVPLAQVRDLRHIPGMLSMELRGCVAMLLHWI